MKMSSTSKRPIAAPRPGRRREEARTLFRNAILESAEAVFAERGFHAARIQDIAKRAGVGVGTVYNHFEQKEDVFRALIDERTEGMLATLAPHTADATRFAAALEARIGRLLGYVEQHRGLFQIVMTLGLSADSDDEAAKELCGKSVKRIERMRAAFREIVEAGIESGDLDANDPADLAAFLAGSIRSLIFPHLLAGAPLVPRAPLIVALFLGGAGRSRRRRSP